MEELKWAGKAIGLVLKGWEWINDKSPIELKDRISTFNGKKINKREITQDTMIIPLAGLNMRDSDGVELKNKIPFKEALAKIETDKTKAQKEKRVILFEKTHVVIIKKRNQDDVIIGCIETKNEAEAYFVEVCIATGQEILYSPDEWLNY